MYTIKKANSREELLALASDAANRIEIKTNPWEATAPNASNPETWAVVAHSDDRFYVVMRSYETAIRTEIKEPWGMVHTDSCMEFFFSPCPDVRVNYFNMEVSASGAMKLNYNERRGVNVSADRDITKYGVEATITDSYWQLVYEIPYAVIRDCAPEFEGKSGDIIKANFYKCGELAAYPHHLMWNPLDINVFPKPDFHRPEGFVEITLA